jgi:hypothetical protein
MKRREFITGLGSAAAWPLVARTQGGRVRRVGVPTSYTEADPEAQSRLVEFRQGLANFGWVEGRNLRLDVHWGAGGLDANSLHLRPKPCGVPSSVGPTSPSVSTPAVRKPRISFRIHLSVTRCATNPISMS